MQTSNRQRNLLDMLGIRLPIVQAPMANVDTPALAAAVSNSGGLGSLAIGAMGADKARAAIRETRRLTNAPFSVNVFCHVPPIADAERESRWLGYLAPHFAQLHAAPPVSLREIYKSFVDDDTMFEMLLQERPPVVSFHFGLPAQARIDALRAAGIVLLACATNVDEARRIAAAGIDAIVAQGIEAGGHRGCFNPDAPDEELGTLALVQYIVRETTLPVIAAGGIMNGGAIAAVLALGAQAAWLGTAFITASESAADMAFRSALTQPDHRTTFTALISGRTARAIENSFTRLASDPDLPRVPGYPIAYDAGKALGMAAKAQGNTAYAAWWAGQGARLSRAMPAAELMGMLMHEAREAIISSPVSTLLDRGA